MKSEHSQKTEERSDKPESDEDEESNKNVNPFETMDDD